MGSEAMEACGSGTVGMKGILVWLGVLDDESAIIKWYFTFSHLLVV